MHTCMDSHPFLLLIAEDDADDVFMMESVLKSTHADWQYIFFSNGNDLIYYLLHPSPAEPLPVSLILLDINMPRKDGMQTLTEIRKIPAYATVPVVGFSTSVATFMVQQFLESGGTYFLQKPDTYDQLQELVARLPGIIQNSLTDR